MSKATFVVLIALSFFSLGAGKAHAQGLLGERYVMFEGGVNILNDEWDNSYMKFDKYNPIIELEVHVPLLSFLDLFAGYGYGKAHFQYYSSYDDSWGPEGDVELYSWGGGFVLHKQVHKTTRLFLSTFAGKSGIKFTESTENFAWSASVGAEIEVGEKFAFRPIVSYSSVVVDDGSSDEDDNGFVGLEFNYWPYDRFFLHASSGLNVESKDIDLLGGVGVRF